jgi:CBS domain-containing protein
MIIERVLQNFPHIVLKVLPSNTVQEVATQFEKKHVGVAMVCDEHDKLVGVVSLGDIVHMIGQRGSEAISLPVRMLMTSDVAACEPKEDVETVLKRMNDVNVRHLPVVEDGKLIGLIKKEDALQVLYDLAALDFAQLRNYVFKVSGRY